MPKGKVREYDADRGFGIIIDADSRQELTVYANFVDLKSGESLNQGQDVEYDIENNRPRNWAVHVTVL